MFGGGPFGRGPREFDWHAKPDGRRPGSVWQPLARMVVGLIVLFVVLAALSLLSPDEDESWGGPDPRSNDPEAQHRIEGQRLASLDW